MTLTMLAQISGKFFQKSVPFLRVAD